ncbi:autotransporter domain-containing protein [Chlamydiifrater volucris]|uniref:autotransporter domain-containing protein n=1 Tax=Chlamydiifrater volucris TaxID=2681470 RepID=UPI001BCE14EF|nr:autotransporter domain-containing protein [Chlamydiifrater volucris]
MKNRYISSFSQSVILAIVASSSLHADASSFDGKKFVATHFLYPFSQERFESNRYFSSAADSADAPPAPSLEDAEDASEEEHLDSIDHEKQSSDTSLQDLKSPSGEEDASSEEYHREGQISDATSAVGAVSEQPSQLSPSFPEGEAEKVVASGEEAQSPVISSPVEGHADVQPSPNSPPMASDSGSKESEISETENLLSSDSEHASPVNEGSSSEEKVAVGTGEETVESPCYTTQMLTSGGKNSASPDDLEGFQYCSQGNVVYEVLGGLAWNNVDALSQVNDVDQTEQSQKQNLSKDEDLKVNDGSSQGDVSEEAEVDNSQESDSEDRGGALHTDISQEDILVKSTPNSRSTACKEHGLAFCNTKSVLEKEVQSNCTVNGVVFSGKSKSDGLLFSNLKAKKGGAAVYSDADVIFENLQRGLTFSGCESSESGGAVAANNITVKGCNGITLTKNKTSLSPSSQESESGSALTALVKKVSPKDDLELGGGAFWAGEGLSLPNKEKIDPQDESEQQPRSGSIQFSGNSGTILVSQNTSTVNGGAMAAKTILFDSNIGNIDFSGNTADFSGGAISSSSSITFLNNKGGISFSENLSCKGSGNAPVKGFGGAIASSEIMFSKNNGDIVFLGNKSGVIEDGEGQEAITQALGSGGAISSQKCSFESNLGKVSFSDNTSSHFGGAIFSKEQVLGKGNLGKIEFSKNQARGSGGAVYCYPDSLSEVANVLKVLSEEQKIVNGRVTFLSNESGVSFSENSSKKKGGAIYAQGVSFSKNSGISFLRNTSVIAGGAIHCEHLPLASDRSEDSDLSEGDVVFSENLGGIVFEGNSVRVSSEKVVDGSISLGKIGGGAVWCKNFKLLNNKGICLFENNSLSDEDDSVGKIAGGGGVYGADSVSISGNMKGVVFSNNSVTGKSVSGEDKAPLGYLRLKTDSSKSLSKSASPVGLQNPFGGGAVSAGSFVLSGNKGDCSFSNNKVSNSGDSILSGDQKVHSGGGAVLAKKSVSLEGNERIIFSYNIASGGKSLGGAILSSQVSLTGNQRIIFDSNSSGYGGGAIYSAGGGVSISENTEVIFSNNYSGTSGGAILLDAKVLSGDVDSFPSNVAQSVESKDVVLEKLLISNNFGPVTFSNNYTTEVFTETSPGDSKTDPYSVDTLTKFGGGVAFLKDLEVSGNKDVLFLFNKSDKGGAFYVRDHGTVSLSADYGNIVFQGNRELGGASDCIFLEGSSSKITKLRAREGHAVQFFDAIIFENTSNRDTSSGGVGQILSSENPSLSINSPDSNSPNLYTGVVQFGGGITKIPQKARLEAGGLVVSNGELWLQGLDQVSGSYVQLSANTVFGQMSTSPETNTVTGSGTPSSLSPVSSSYNKKQVFTSSVSASSAAEANVQQEISPGFNLTELRVDLASFSKDSTPPRVVIVPATQSGSSSVNLLTQNEGGPNLKFVLVDSSGESMEGKHDLFSDNSNIQFVEFMKKGENGNLESTNIPGSGNGNFVTFSLGQGLDKGQYGYQGTWDVKSLTNGSVQVQWTRTGYSLNPNKDGSVVANGLWSQYTDARGIKGQIFHNHVTDQRMEMDFFTNVWGAGLGQFVNSVVVGDVDGFVHRAGGYVLGMDTEIIQDFLVGGSFAQTFGYTDSRLHSIRCSERGYIGSVYAGISHYGRGSGTWMFKGAVLYGNIGNDMSVDYGSNLGVSKGSWSDHSLLASVRVDRKKFSNSRSFSSAMITAWAPFVEVEYAFIDQMPFLEVGGTQVRDFEKGKLQNLAVPMGITFENYYSRGTKSESLSFSVAYSPDAYRRNPKGSATVVEAKHSWITRGCKWPRHAVRCRLDNNTEWNESLGTYISFEYEGRRHVASYNFSGGARLIF